MHQMEEERTSSRWQSQHRLRRQRRTCSSRAESRCPYAPPADPRSPSTTAKIEYTASLVKVADASKGRPDKLLRLEVDIGTEVGQILAGIAEAYDPEPLAVRKVVIVANLAPRKLRGLESNGIYRAASLEGGASLCSARIPGRCTVELN